MTRNERSKVFPDQVVRVIFFAKNGNIFLYLLQALLNPLQKNPAMGPRVLAKRLIIVQCKRNGEGEPEREKEVTATMATMARI